MITDLKDAKQDYWLNSSKILANRFRRKGIWGEREDGKNKMLLASNLTKEKKKEKKSNVMKW